MNRVRFSKSGLAQFIQLRMDAIQREHDFDPNNGTAQLRIGNVGAAVEYGALRELEHLSQEYDLGCRIQRRRDL